MKTADSESAGMIVSDNHWVNRALRWGQSRLVSRARNGAAPDRAAACRAAKNLDSAGCCPFGCYGDRKTLAAANVLLLRCRLCLLART
jgi:hypothetical protein